MKKLKNCISSSSNLIYQTFWYEFNITSTQLLAPESVKSKNEKRLFFTSIRNHQTEYLH